MARRPGCPRASLRLDAGFLRFPRPFGDFAFDIVRKLVRAHRRNIESHDPEARLDLRLGDAPVDGVVEPVDDVARRAGGRHQAVPRIVSKPGSSSAIAGISGASGVRTSEVTPRLFILPPLICARPTAKSAKVNETWPDSVSATASGTPL